VNVAELLAIPASMFPEQEALVFEGRGFTYERLAGMSGGMQSWLAERGVSAGDVVAVLDTNSPALVAALYGSTALGARFAPLNYRARAEELRNMLGVIQPKLLLAGERYLGLAREVGAGQTMPLEGSVRDGDLLSAEVEDDAPAILMFTSGTSADAKAAVLPHGIGGREEAGHAGDDRPTGDQH